MASYGQTLCVHYQPDALFRAHRGTNLQVALGGLAVLQIWKKQNLKIKSVIGNTINAVANQIFLALCVYLLMTYLKFVSQSAFSIQSILRLLQMNLILRRPLGQLLHKWKADPPPPQTAFSRRFA